MTEGKPEARRDERHKIRLPADRLTGKRRETLLTENVSFRGMFLRTDRPPSVRSLVEIEMLLPPDDTRIRLHGTVIHVVKPGDPSGRAPGVGVEFLTLAGGMKSTWEGFVRRIQPARTESRERMEAVRTAGVPDRVRRRFERHKTDLQLLVDETGDLKTLLAKDVSEGGMFVATSLPMPVGHSFSVTVVHPQTAAHFRLSCVVRRHEPRANPPGVGVEFVGMDAAVHASFLEFIANELPVLSVGEEEVSEDQIDAWEDEEPTNVKPRTIR